MLEIYALFREKKNKGIFYLVDIIIKVYLVDGKLYRIDDFASLWAT